MLLPTSSVCGSSYATTEELLPHAPVVNASSSLKSRAPLTTPEQTSGLGGTLIKKWSNTCVELCNERIDSAFSFRPGAQGFITIFCVTLLSSSSDPAHVV